MISKMSTLAESEQERFGFGPNALMNGESASSGPRWLRALPIAEAQESPNSDENKLVGSSGRTRTYSLSVNSRMAYSRLALQTEGLHVRLSNYSGN